MPDRHLDRFRRDESGAVAVDWVVLTGGALIFAILVVSTIASGANDTSTGIGARLSDAEVPEVTLD